MNANLLDGLPPEAKRVLVLQFGKWTKAKRDEMAKLTRAWTQVHKQVFEDRFAPLLERPVRWK